MRDAVEIIRERQMAVRRQIDERQIALKAVAFDSGIEYPTLLTYFPAEGSSREPAQIPGGAIFALCAGKALPADLLSLLVPNGWMIVQVPENLDHDELCGLAQEYVAKKAAAHRVDSECGVDIGPGEKAGLDATVVQLRAA